MNMREGIGRTGDGDCMMGDSFNSGALTGSRASTEPVARLGPPGFDPERLWALLDDPEGQAAFMLRRLNEAQRAFILAVKPTLQNQRISRRLFDSAWPGVETGAEWPDQFWFGGGCAHYPAGRPPIGNRRSSYSFRFNKAGLFLRDALAAGDAAQRRSHDD